jgi:RNA polymerase sigma factor FliA
MSLSPTARSRAPRSAPGISKHPSSFHARDVSPALSAGLIDAQAAIPPGLSTEADLWARWHAARDPACRDYLIAKYHRIVRAIAAKCAKRLPSLVEVDDLVSVGLFGLVRAMESFEPARGVKFQTFCGKHILGAINDWLREVDWAPRAVRRSEAVVRRVENRFQMQHGRPPSREELAQGVREERPDDTRAIELVLKDSNVVGVTSLSAEREDGRSNGSTFRMTEAIADRRQPTAAELARKRLLKDLVTKGLDRERQLVLVLYYYENLTMREIGLVLDKSESRVSQMHAEILDWLRTRLAERAGELLPGM